MIYGNKNMLRYKQTSVNDICLIECKINHDLGNIAKKKASEMNKIVSSGYCK